MRLDKFLMNSKIVKRRVLAHDLCEGGKVKKNEKILKPSYKLKENDLITIELANRVITIKIKENTSFEILKEHRK
ncbi:hypothetical protein OSSY52_21480 [Tepiditoga spiralis]|uniref:RNA-binding S4 domain-containing protein n=1 Tax=Tepiditoga spiralis TaxID=2108365 RepID=A0A7G1GAA0_9BACT|nr:S4 domain-containing protein [Tepiditoga spiralis]BBE32007.1 hypothetical protein OSSY52_21480 [Tepiditoga spiralis]